MLLRVHSLVDSTMKLSQINFNQTIIWLNFKIQSNFNFYCNVQWSLYQNNAPFCSRWPKFHLPIILPSVGNDAILKPEAHFMTSPLLSLRSTPTIQLLNGLWNFQLKFPEVKIPLANFNKKKTYKLLTFIPLGNDGILMLNLHYVCASG